MSTLLIFPPVSDAAHAPLGIASLAGYLRANGEQVQLVDLNILSYHQLTTPSNLAECKQRTLRKLQYLERLDSLTLRQAQEYLVLAEAVFRADYVIDSITDALNRLRDADAYTDRLHYGAAASVIRSAMEVVAAAHFPATWSPRSFGLSYSVTSTADVLKGATDESQNFFIPFFKQYLSRLKHQRYEVIGISINYFCQLIPGITLAILLRDALAKSRIALGGSLMSFFNGRWESLLPFSPFVDAVVPYQGEIPLLEIVRATRNNAPLSTIPGIVCFAGGSAIFNPLKRAYFGAYSYLPDFTDLPLDDYLSPRRILPYATSSGCYWAQCAFCAQQVLHRQAFQRKPLNLILEDLSSLSDRYNAYDFYLVDEAIPPETAEQLAVKISQEGRPYRWFGEMRFEASLDAQFLRNLAHGGCLMLIWGLESGVQRVLDRMQKGTDPNVISRILKDCSQVGIKSFIMFFIGFPTETKDEALSTIQFIEAHDSQIQHIGFGHFILMRGSPVFTAPARYGIKRLTTDAINDLAIDANYEVAIGMSQKEAIETVREMEKRAMISNMIELGLVSRCHLSYLPLRGTPAIAESIQSWRGGILSQQQRLQVPERIVALVLKFNLKEIRSLLESHIAGSSKLVQANRTGYIFDPLTEKRLVLGEEGLSLLALCDGTKTLREILRLLGEQNLAVVMDFYTRLYADGFLIQH
jgi:anaerobic magnesium-protoporphyrin IX monomethyl ester cyclase